MKKRFNIFKILGFQISLDYSWFIIFALIIWTLSAGYFPRLYPNLDRSTYLIMGVIAAVLLFISVLFHELSHSYVARSVGIGIKGITLFIFGGLAQLTQEPDKASKELKVAVAGPLASIFFALFLKLLTFIPTWIISFELSAVFEYVAMLNLILAIFNLIPGFPLDGGRILRAIIWERTKNLRRATDIASKVGKIFAFLLIIFGIFSIFYGSFIAGLWYIFIGIFLHQAADISYRQVAYKDMLTGVAVADLMSQNVITVDEDISAQELVNKYFFRYRYDIFPVVSGDILRGVVSLDEVKEVPREKWDTVTAGEIMTPVSEGIILHPEDDAVDALMKMVKDGMGRLPVVSKGYLVGILTRRDIMDLLKIKTDLGE
ncbi:MAG: site-2 protease family protein [Fidelibacterota bacterium]